ncbi:hypothetical protein DFH11DRAFT_1729295 [Phellopilus nigrolimitatus]|nr:hypothetical protein DFH11DRAFT_1729295 [Phellopilus nigrolimitatus]
MADWDAAVRSAFLRIFLAFLRWVVRLFHKHTRLLRFVCLRRLRLYLHLRKQGAHLEANVALACLLCILADADVTVQLEAHLRGGESSRRNVVYALCGSRGVRH